MYYYFYHLIYIMNGFIVFSIITLLFLLLYIFSIYLMKSLFNRIPIKLFIIVSIVLLIIYLVVLFLNKQYILYNPYSNYLFQIHI